MGGIVSKKSPQLSPRSPDNQHLSKAAESWKEIKAIGLEKVGGAVFSRLFAEYPDAFQMFKTFREETDWKQNKAFLSHSRLVINVIGGAVVKHQSADDLHTMMQSVGSAHSLFAIREEYFETMKDELLKQIQAHLQEKFDEEVRDVWSQAFDAFHQAMTEAIANGSLRTTTHAAHT